MNIIFVRHGRTEHNRAGVFGGVSDVPLSADGRKEIEGLKYIYEAAKTFKVYTSSLKRARETAEILFEGNALADPRLCETNFGIFEGLTYDEISQRYPEETKLWNGDYFSYAPRGGESLSMVFDRTEAFITEVSKQEGTVIAVTHSGVIRSALSIALGSREYFYKFRISHGLASVVTLEKGYGFIRGINCQDIEKVML